MEGYESPFKILTDEPTRRLLGRPRRIWEVNVRMYLREIRDHARY